MLSSCGWLCALEGSKWAHWVSVCRHRDGIKCNWIVQPNCASAPGLRPEVRQAFKLGAHRRRAGSGNSLEDTPGTSTFEFQGCQRRYILSVLARPMPQLSP